jgi:CRP-like cAMP-binding protein
MVVDNDLLGYFRKDSPVRVRAQRLHDDLAGAQTFFIRITSGQPGFFKQPENLARIAEIQKRMEEMGYFDKTVSFADPVRLIHREMNGGREEEYNVPGTKELIAQYLVFLRRDDIETYVTPGFDEANILVRHNIASSYLLKKVTRELEGEIRKILHPPLQFGLTGENILINTSADSLVRGQIAGIGILLLVVFVLTGFLFVNVKAGCLSLFPNLLPVVLNFGVMALCGIPLNTGTCMVAAIAIGIATENTIHFMSRYNKEMRNLQDRNKAMEACIRSELRPCVSASMALAMGFGVLAFSHFVPVGHFGLLSALVMLYALLANFLLTPLLLFATQLTTLIDMAALRLNQDVIKAPKLFAGLKAWQTKKVVLLGRLEKKDAGEYVVREGEFGKSLFLILEGKATAFGRGGTGNEIVFASLGPGDIFGEVALVEPGPRTASVRADETIQFIEIDWDGLERVQKLYSGVASQLFLNLSRILGKRLAAADKMLTHLPEGSKP